MLMAWLSSTPKKKTRSRREQIERHGGKNSPLLDLPSVPGADYIVGYLFEAGPTSGEHCLSWSDLKAWSDVTGVQPSEFEAVTMVALSREYLAMARKAQEPECPRPIRLTAEQKQAAAAAQAAAARARHRKD